MRNLVNQNPRMARLFSVGRSYEGREQRAIEVIIIPYTTVFFDYINIFPTTTVCAFSS